MNNSSLSVAVFIFALLLVVIAVSVSFIAWRQQRPDMKMLNEAMEEMRRVHKDYGALRDVNDTLRKDIQDLRSENQSLRMRNRELMNVNEFLVTYVVEHANVDISSFPLYIVEIIKKHQEGRAKIDVVRGDEVDKVQLKRLMIQHFSLNDLRDIVYDLQFQDDKSFSENKPVWCGELIEYCEQEDRLADLIGLIQEKRPRINWLPIVAPR